VTEQSGPVAELVNEVRRDLRPVRPFLSPAVRALFLLPIGLALIVGIPAYWGWRGNLPMLGFGGSWGLSALEALAGLSIVGWALREAIPGRELSRGAVAAIAACAVLLFLGSTLLSAVLAPVPFRGEVFVHQAWGCLRRAAVWSLPALAVAAWLAARAAATRPALAGAICGLGAGLMADAGVRLSCSVSTPAHVLVGHGAAILLLVLAGSAAAVAADRLTDASRRERRALSEQ